MFGRQMRQAEVIHEVQMRWDKEFDGLMRTHDERLRDAYAVYLAIGVKRR